MSQQNPQIEARKAELNKLADRYTFVHKNQDGEWITTLKVGVQSFEICRRETCEEAIWYCSMMGKALNRVVLETLTNGGIEWTDQPEVEHVNEPQMPPSAPVADIVAERIRQVTLGYDAAHDDEHDEGEIALAAACYAAPQMIYVDESNSDDRGEYRFVDPWPFDWTEDKRRWYDRRRQLVIAGAMIIAEIERLDRKAQEK